MQAAKSREATVVSGTVDFMGNHHTPTASPRKDAPYAPYAPYAPSGLVLA